MSQTLQKILVPVDDLSHTAEALHYAATMAGPLTELLVVHVIARDVTVCHRRRVSALPYHPMMSCAAAQAETPVSTDLREQAKTALAHYLAAQLPRRAVKQRVEVGRPDAEILRVAGEEGVDLIVMGTHGRTGLTRMMMGSVAEQVTRLASCPVMSVKSPGVSAA